MTKINALDYGETPNGAAWNLRKLFRTIDAAMQCNVISATTTAQPASPAQGDLYIIPSSATGALWSTFAAGSLAQYRTNEESVATWTEIVPGEGWRAWIKDTDRFVVYNGGWKDALPQLAKVQRTFYVDDYGADPTGVATSNTGIDAAFDALLAAGSGTLKFKKGGTYKIDGSAYGTTFLYALNLRRVLIATEGCRFTSTTNYADGEFFNFLRFEGCEFWEVQDFEWVASPTAAYTADDLKNRGVRLIGSRNANGGGRIGRIAASGGTLATGIDLFRADGITAQCFDLFVESLDIDRGGYPLAVRNSGRGVKVGRIRCNEVHRPIIAYGFRDLEAIVERYSNGAGVVGETQLHIMSNGDGSNLDQDDDISAGLKLTLRGGPAPRDAAMISFECRGTSPQQLRDINVHFDVDMDSSGSTSQRAIVMNKRSDATTVDSTTRGHRFDLTLTGEIRSTPTSSTWAEFYDTTDGDWAGEDVRLDMSKLRVLGAGGYTIDYDGFTAEAPKIDNTRFPSWPTETGTPPPAMAKLAMLRSLGDAYTLAGDTNEHTALSFTIPGRTLGKNGRVRVTVVGTVTNDSSAKTVRVKLGSFEGYSNSWASTGLFRFQTEIINQNSLSVQLGHVISSGWGGSSGAVTAGAQNTAGDLTLAITGQKGDGTDTFRFDAILVEVFYVP